MPGPPQAAGQQGRGSSIPPCWGSPEPGLVEPLPSPPGIWGGVTFALSTQQVWEMPWELQAGQQQPPATGSCQRRGDTLSSGTGTGSAPGTATARGQASGDSGRSRLRWSAGNCSGS